MTRRDIWDWHRPTDPTARTRRRKTDSCVLPLLGGHLIVLIATAITVQGAPPIPMDGSEQAAIAADSLMSGRAIQIATYAYTALYLWCCYVLVYVLKHARDLSMRRAFVAVVIPVVLLNMFGFM